MTRPADPRRVKLCFISHDDDAFIIGVWGEFTLDQLDKIEEQVQEEQELYLPENTETPCVVTYIAEWVPPQIGNYPPPNVEAPGYWDLTPIKATNDQPTD